MECVPKIEIVVLSINLKHLPPTQLNFLVDESSYDSSSENTLKGIIKKQKSTPTTIKGSAM